MLLYLARRHRFEIEAALLANANAGGDNVHRGMLLGLILGAAHDTLPDHLISGLASQNKIKNEIEGFCEIALSGNGL